MINGGTIWIVAAFVGFLVWWPIGVAFLVTIFLTAVSQQLIGYSHRRDAPYIGEATIVEKPMRQINQVKVRALPDR